MRRFGLSLMVAIGAGCPASDDDGDPAATTVGTESGDPSTLTDAPDPSATGTEGTSNATDGSTPASCAAARTEAECASVDEIGFQCSWLQTRHWALAADGTCEDMMMEGGQCVTSQEDSGCGSLDPSCPDGSTVVFFNASDPPGGALELMIAPSFDHCDAPPGWDACEYGQGDTDGSSTDESSTGGSSTDGGTTGGQPSWDPPECACGCPS